MNVQSYLALLCALLVSAPWTYAQQNSGASEGLAQPSDTTPRLENEAPRWYSHFTSRYTAKISPPVNVSNSSRLDSLIRAGNLYLSLADAVALALENNIDIEIQRYNFPLANVDLDRAKIGAQILGGTNFLSSGSPPLGSISNAGLANGGTLGTTGPGFGPLTNYDPVFTSTINWQHQTTPENNTITTGTAALIARNQTYNFAVTDGFPTGAVATFSYDNTNTYQNAPRNAVNPVNNAFMDITVTQPLLQGFGMAMNNRYIRIAKNNLRVTDLAFEQQVITTVNTVTQAYWALVTYISSVDVANQSLAQSTKLKEDNEKQVDIGTLAPISVVQAEAQMATDQQTLVNAQTNVLLQETALKNLLSRNGVASPLLTDAHIIPTDRIVIPDVEATPPVQDLVTQALARRPDLEQARLQVDSSKINLVGARNALLPSLNIVGDFRNSGLSGAVNTVPLPPGTTASPADPFFVGGYGDVLRQIFGRNFPTYSLGATLSIPLRNRAAEANMATAQLQYSQTELQLQKAINQIRVDVQTALTQLLQARAQFQAAFKGVDLEVQTLDAEQKKLELGASTPYNVILIQRDLATAQLSLVQARQAYANARVQLDQATGMLLERANVHIDEARSGHVAKAPDRIPAAAGGLPTHTSNVGLRR